MRSASINGPSEDGPDIIDGGNRPTNALLHRVVPEIDYEAPPMLTRRSASTAWCGAS